MKANSIAIFGLAAVIAMPCFALDDAVTLSRTCKKGQITSYADSTTMKAAAGEGTQTAKYRYEITEIKPNGDVVTVVHFDGGHVKSPRGEQDIPGGVDITETRDKAGRLLAWKRNVEADTFIAEEVRELMAAVSEAILPDKPVKVG